MGETAAHSEQPKVGRLNLAIAKRLGLAPPPPEESSVSYAELVWAHFKRQEEVDRDTPGIGPWEREYRDRLRRFKQQHGEILEEYWCRGVASGAMLTARLGRRRWTRLFKRDSILRLHAATDWRTADSQYLSAYVYRWQTAGIKASEILRGTSERIALHRIFNGVTRVLAFADCEGAEKTKPWGDLARFRAVQDAQLADVDAYYRAAGQNQGRIVYFLGMVVGALVLAATVGGAFLLAWQLDWIDPSHEPTYTLFVTIAMGAGGAILSVMTRMAKEDSFSVEFEVGRKAVRFLGALRPWIGALFALALYLALKSNLLEFLQGVDHSVYFYAAIGFLTGFSERRAKVLIDGMGGPLAAKTEEPPRAPAPAPAVKTP